MIPILYAPSISIEWGTEPSPVEDIDNNVPLSWAKTILGYLPDAIKCVHTETRNGSYELEMTYPDTGTNAALISNNCIIQVKSADPYEDEPNFPLFRIYKINRDLSGMIYIYARHITEWMSYQAVLPYEDGHVMEYSVTNPYEFFSYLRFRHYKYPAYRDNGIVFDFYTDIEDEISAVIRFSDPTSVKSYLGGGDLPEGARSMLQIFGGEYKYVGWQIQLLQNRGVNTGYELRYASNISGINIQEDVDGIFTAVLGYALLQNGTYVYAFERAKAAYLTAFPVVRTRAVDFTSSFSSEDTPTWQDVAAAARSYIDTQDIGNPVRMIDVDIVLLENTKEWEQYGAIADLQLCDTVRLVYDRNGINLTADMKVVELTYDVLRERTTNVKIGTIQRTMVKELAQNTLYRQYRT